MNILLCHCCTDLVFNINYMGAFNSNSVITGGVKLTLGNVVLDVVGGTGSPLDSVTWIR